jgi:hypothetical protein
MPSKSKGQSPPDGELRQSQILTTFGPGSMVDLIDKSVIISGLNHWFGYKNKLIEEERLSTKVAQSLGVRHIKLYAPPADESDPNKPRTGINAFVFPQWFVAQTNETITRGTKTYRTRPLLSYYPEKGKYVTDDKKKVSVVPVRFVKACPHGHISDIDWRKFIGCDCRGQLYLDEGGAGNDFSNIFVRCERCNKLRPLSDATIPGTNFLGYCNGERPWLGPNANEECFTENEQGQRKVTPNRLLVRSASNAYFSQILSVISIPDNDAKLRDAVTQVYEDFLQYAEDVDEIKKERRKPKVAHALEGFDDETVWEEIQRRKAGTSNASKDIKDVEIETLLSVQDTLGTNQSDSDFYACIKEIQSSNPLIANKIEKIVLVPRLREVIALIGFTRFEPLMMGTSGEFEEDISVGSTIAALDLEPTWVPAIENKGEGIFISFKKSAIKQWLENPQVIKRGKDLVAGHENWCNQRELGENKRPEFVGIPYIMLHSLAHLLITTISLECGYSASAIKERIYVSDAGYGILLYTGTTGSEGTLGGLIEIGKKIESYLEKAIESSQLCSNDPICSQHNPTNQQEDRPLHGCACHGCLLIAETSCERRNEYLDRALIATTLNHNYGFFHS